MTISRATRALRSVMPLAIAVATLTACDDDPFSPYWDRGTYYLSYANGRSVPAIVSGSYGPNSPRVEVTGGTLTLRRDHSYSLLVQVREWSGAQFYESTKVFAGTYDSDERTIWLNYFQPHDYYSSVMIANWRNGRIDVVVPDLDGGVDVLCMFE